MKKYKVLLDTNMLMLIGKGIDVFDQISEILVTKPEFYIVKQVINELNKIKEKGGIKERKTVELVLRLIKEKCKIINIDVKEYASVDDLILELASEEGYIVATNDRELRKKLRKKGVPQIYLREEKYLLEAWGIE